MAVYNLTTSQADRINLDEHAKSCGVDDARAMYPDTVSGSELTAYASGIVNQALDENEDLTDDLDEYRARFVDAYCKAYQAEVQDRQQEEAS